MTCRANFPYSPGATDCGHDAAFVAHVRRASSRGLDDRERRQRALDRSEVAQNIFNVTSRDSEHVLFRSSLDLIGASRRVPHSSKISRLRKDLKRHAQEFQNTSSITLVLDRTSPCPSAWRAINSLCRRYRGSFPERPFKARTDSATSVNREAMQILIDTLARGPPSKPEESVLCSIVSDNPSTSSFLTLRPDAPLHAAMFRQSLGLIISSNVNVVLPVAPWITALYSVERARHAALRRG